MARFFPAHQKQIEVTLAQSLIKNSNVVVNGNFELVPNFVAATTTNQKWIDGTATGSSISSNYYGVGFATGSGAAQFDSSVSHSGSSSLKVSTVSIAQFIEVHTSRQDTNSSRLQYALPIAPNTTYLYSFWMKTNVVSGDSNNGAFVLIGITSSTGAVISSVTTSPVKITQNWTQYTGTFTTPANAVGLSIMYRIYGHTGTGTLIMDAWFDDVVIKQA